MLKFQVKFILLFLSQEAKQEAVENNDENGVKEDEMNDDEMNFSLPTKKKKKKKVQCFPSY